MIAAVLLAAGRSIRFGSADKLAAPLGDMPLGLHAVRALAPLPFVTRIVVTRPAVPEWQGWDVVVNDRAEEGMAHSIALGVAAARRTGAEAILIALADMPFVPTAHFRNLMARYHGASSLVASSDGRHRMPPALFGANWFERLEGLEGDRGARTLLDQAEMVVTTAGKLFDVDRPEDLTAARARLSE